MGGEAYALKVARAQYVCTILLALSIAVYCCFAAFSIGVLDVNNENKLHNQRPPWPTLQSPIRYYFFFFLFFFSFLLP